MNFSAPNRSQLIQRLTTETFDVLVIGGGITGAGIALDAAARGLRVALIEKNDFAFGTSSRSTKLIHGGLRYLKQFEFGLVKEVGSERAIVHDLAPHLVVPEKMLLPLHEKRGLGYWLASGGLKLYDWLAGVKAIDRRRMLTRQQTLRAEPLLKPDGIKGGALYAEYRTDDARLTIEIVKAAVAHGAIALSYLEVTGFDVVNDRIQGVRTKDGLSASEYMIKASSVVNAAGPWVDTLREKDGSLSGKRLHLTKGVHVVVPRVRLPLRQAIYFDVEADGRMIFAIPRGRTTYIGTTDTTYNEDKDTVATTREDAEYLLAAVNATFPDANLHLSDVESSWAGLRPLIHEDGKSANELSRKDEIFESRSGLISIAGGKLTGYRKMAERVVNLLIRKHYPGRKPAFSDTRSIKLAGSSFRNEKELKAFEASMIENLARHGIPSYTASSLVENFGTQANAILNNYLTDEADADSERKLLTAILNFCLDHEMTVRLDDFFVRRTGLLYFDIKTVIKHMDWIASRMALHFSWDNDRTMNELAHLQELIRRAQIH